MADPMRIRASEKDGEIDVKILMKHDMESGQRKDAAGAIIPAWHITTLVATVNDKEVFAAQFGPAVSKDPFLNFKFKGAAKGEGERIIIAAKAEIEQETHRAREALRGDVAALVIAGAGKVLRREVNAQAHADLLEAIKNEL